MQKVSTEKYKVFCEVSLLTSQASSRALEAYGKALSKNRSDLANFPPQQLVKEPIREFNDGLQEFIGHKSYQSKTWQRF